MAIKSSWVRKKSQTSAWLPSTSSTKKAREHRRTYNLSAMAAAAVMAAGDAVMAGDAMRVEAVEVATTDAAVTAAEVATTVAVAAAA